MPNPYLENKERWLALAEPDYLILFVKAWIPFNAWYSNTYAPLKQDRQILTEIKNNPNLFRNKLTALLSGNTYESKKFKNTLSDLHKSLESTFIPQPTRRITLTSLVIERNPVLVETSIVRNWTYKAEVVYTGTTNYTIDLKIIGRDGSTKYTWTQVKYDKASLTTHLATSTISQYQQLQMLKAYEKINPKKPSCLIVSNNRNFINIGEYKMTNNVDDLSKAIIEILYRLRCILFHGELNPSLENRQPYQHSYYILRTLIQSLN